MYKVEFSGCTFTYISKDTMVLHSFNDEPSSISDDGRRMHWHKNAMPHRDGDKPAVIDRERQSWLVDGKLHRVGAPATIFTNGNKEWYVNGDLHREDGPAFESKEQCKWYINGKLHRTDGPAVVGYDANGNVCREDWYFEGSLHRTDGPAVVDGSNEEWWTNGARHRADGPAMYTAGTDQGERYFYNGEEYFNISSNEEWKRHVKSIILK